MNFYELMRLSMQTGQAVVLPSNIALKRHMPATTDTSSATTGTSIIGQFETFRDRAGRRVFIGENGQYRRM